MRRKLIWIGAALALLAVAAAAALFWLTGRPLYEPGSVRAGVNLTEPLEPPAARAADPSFFQVAEGVRLFTFSEGTGEDILVLHGGPCLPPSAPWPAGAALSDRFRLVYYHQRGCGKSSRPFSALPGQSSWEDMQALHGRLGFPAQIADIERIRRLLGRERLVLAGHSFGGLLASLYAAEFPERVSALVLVSPAPLLVMPVEGGDLFTRVAEKLPASQVAEFDSWRRQFFDFRARLREPDEALATRYGAFLPFYAAATGSAPRPGDAAGGLMPYAMFLGLGQRHDWRSSLAKVTAPVLVVHGARDLQSEAQSRSVAAAFPRSRFVTIAGAGHFAHEDAPAELAEAIRPFLESR